LNAFAPCDPHPTPTFNTHTHTHTHTHNRLFGLSKAAHKLAIGYTQWAMNNDFKNDTQLMFASASLQQLHARLEPEERRDYLLTWCPPAQEGVHDSSEPEHPAARLGWRQYSLNCLAGEWLCLVASWLLPWLVGFALEMKG